MATAATSNRDLELSGGLGRSTLSARAGLVPISLERAPLSAFEGIAVYLRVRDPHFKTRTTFTLYCSPRVDFTSDHRLRLGAHGVQFVYIPIADQQRFRQQTEATLLETVDDPGMSVSVKSEIVYETSVELVNELLPEPRKLAESPRIEKLSRAVTMLVLNDRKAFAHLFAASHHDFYTATHMVNVGTWMVPLAYALGHRRSDELTRICRAGLLHDIGKMHIPAAILNKKGRLSDEEWRIIQSHPEQGSKYLEQFKDIHPVIHRVVREHHERLDGSGYPSALAKEQIHPISRICAVVDSFDAMTALRPFKERTLTIAQALGLIVKETPARYDPGVVDAWLRLLTRAETAGTLSESLQSYDGALNRAFERFRVSCPARVHLLKLQNERWVEKSPVLNMTAHNISRSGIGLLSETPVQPNETVRIQLLGRGSLRRSGEGVTVRCRAFKDGWFELGVRFRSLVEETDLAALSRLNVPVAGLPDAAISQVPIRNSR